MVVHLASNILSGNTNLEQACLVEKINSLAGYVHLLISVQPSQLEFMRYLRVEHSTIAS